MNTQYIKTSTTQKELPLAYNIVSAGILELSDTDNSKVGRLYHIQVNDEWCNYYVLYV